MNTLLASSPTLTLRTYTICTALALPKLLVHCALGTSIKNFAAYNGAGADIQVPVSSGDSSSGSTTLLGSDVNNNDASASATAERIKQIAGFVGVGLCIGIFLYLFSVARKAVDEELDDDEGKTEEYDLMLSDEGEDEELDTLDAESGSDIDEDTINITRGSSDSAKGSSCPSLQESSQSSISVMHFPKVSGRVVNGSETTLVDAPLRASEQDYNHHHRSLEPVTISHVNQKTGVYNEGKTPNFVAPRSLYESDSNPYFSQNFNINSIRSARRMESQTSLADSIIEMEKHVVEMENGLL